MSLHENTQLSHFTREKCVRRDKKGHRYGKMMSPNFRMHIAIFGSTTIHLQSLWKPSLLETLQLIKGHCKFWCCIQTCEERICPLEQCSVTAQAQHKQTQRQTTQYRQQGVQNKESKPVIVKIWIMPVVMLVWTDWLWSFSDGAEC